VSRSPRPGRESFLVYASHRARAEAEAAGLGVLENKVREAILAGRVVGYGEERLVRLDGGYCARTLRQDHTPQGRRRLLVKRLEATPPINHHNGGRRP
jgi:hypothetical protein